MFIYDTIPNISGVYIIKCHANKKIYIGSTEVLDKKLEDYNKKLIARRFRISKINEDINKYGDKSFEIGYLCTCNHEVSTIIERYYIKKYKSIEFGYNSNNASKNLIKKHKYNFTPIASEAKLDSAINRVLEWFITDIVNLDEFTKTELVTLIEIDREISERYKMKAEPEVLLGILHKLDLICYIKDCEYENLYYEICGVQLIDLIYDKYFFIKNKLGKKLINMFRRSIDLNDILIEVPLIKNKVNKVNKTSLFKEKNIIVDLRNNKWFDY